MGLRAPLTEVEQMQAKQEALAALYVKDETKWGDPKDRRIFYCGLTQAALQSMPLGQFAPDLATHLVNVRAAVDELAAFILERAK